MFAFARPTRHNYPMKIEILCTGDEILTGKTVNTNYSHIARRLAAWAAILAVPTAIAGIYGMNFEVMPELKWEYGYLVVLGAVATICGTLYYRLRKSGWL